MTLRRRACDPPNVKKPMLGCEGALSACMHDAIEPKTRFYNTISTLACT